MLNIIKTLNYEILLNIYLFIKAFLHLQEATMSWQNFVFVGPELNIGPL